MSRPTNKNELLLISNENYNELFNFVNAFSVDDLHGKFPFENRDKNIRDVLAHLHHWHTMMLKWYEVGMAGNKPDMPAYGYTWKTTADLNAQIWKMYQDKNYDEIVLLINKSFSKLQAIISKHSNEELFEKKRYKWTGTTSLGSYLVSATSSHYDWAMKVLKKYKKAIS